MEPRIRHPMQCARHIYDYRFRRVRSELVSWLRTAMAHRIRAFMGRHQSWTPTIISAIAPKRSPHAFVGRIGPIIRSSRSRRGRCSRISIPRAFAIRACVVRQHTICMLHSDALFLSERPKSAERNPLGYLFIGPYTCVNVFIPTPLPSVASSAPCFRPFARR